MQINQQAGGRISRGAIVEREVPLQLGDRHGVLDLCASGSPLQRTVAAINHVGRSVASARDGGLIQLQGPLSPNTSGSTSWRGWKAYRCCRSLRRRVILNSPGAVVLNGAVKLPRGGGPWQLCPSSSTPNARSASPSRSAKARPAVTRKSNISVQQQGTALRMIEGSADLVDVVKALNALGATPQDLMSILEALKAAGSLRAELEII